MYLIKMIKKKIPLLKKIKRKKVVSGSGIIGSILNKAIDLLPVELHIPGYNFCGPGTKLEKRLKRGDKGINKLDDACREHDIAYSNPNQNRTEADKKLAALAWERVKSPDASLGERSSAYLVTNLLNAKTKFGGGLFLRPYKGCGLFLKPYKGCGLQKNKNKTIKKKVNQKRIQETLRKILKKKHHSQTLK